jgi:hypothetical protein
VPLATFRAIVKCLHPDRTPSAEEREHACKLFNDLVDAANTFVSRLFGTRGRPVSPAFICIRRKAISCHRTGLIGPPAHQ